MGFFLLAACSADGEETLPATSGGGEGQSGMVRVDFAADGLVATRAVPGGSDDLQHVRDVYLYVYDDGGKLVWQDDVGWERPFGGTERGYYMVPRHVLPLNATYTFVAVGVDDVAGDTYGLAAPAPSADWQDLPAVWRNETGNLLPAEQMLKAVAVEGESLKQRIAKTEIYAGSRTEEIREDENNRIHIDLRRRVAGVLAYFTNIPAGVTEIRLVVANGQAQRAEVPLLPREADDFGTAELDGEEEVVLSMPVSLKSLDAEVNEDGVPKLVGSALRTAYMLPLPAKGDDTAHTFQLQLLADEAVTQTKNVVWKDETGASVTDFPILANHFYSIGRKDATTDEPFDLGGTAPDVVIYVDGNWQAEVNIPM